jgi:hypothetical protein
MKKSLTLALALVALAVFSGFRAAPGLAKSAPQNVHCFCKAIENVGNTAGTSIGNPLIDFGQLAAYWTGIGNNSDCENKCSQAAANNANFNNKTWLCQQIKQGGHHRVSAYAAVGANGTYRVAQSIEFDCTGGVTTCKCPTGWTCNGCSPQVDGGWTSDGKCKKVACQASTIPPFPPDGTPIGSWGFTWGNAFIAWGTSANGGKPGNCITTPWEGH